MSDLEKMLESAPSDITNQETTSDDEVTYGEQKLTADELCEAAGKVLTDSLDICNDPLFHKLIMMNIVDRMVRWHKNASEDQDDPDSAGAWMRDAGKLQAVMNILTTVTIGPDDFTVQ